MTNETHTYQHTVSELMAQQGITITALAKRAGIAYSTAKRAVDGGIFANNVSSAHRIATTWRNITPPCSPVAGDARVSRPALTLLGERSPAKSGTFFTARR